MTHDDLLAPLPEDARMDAYYYGFDRTGVGLIDAILSAVAIAGKGAHHTEDWGDENATDYYAGRPGLPDATSPIDLIQSAANQAAERIRAYLNRDPDWCYNANDWEYMLPWEDSSIMTDDIIFADGRILEVGTLYEGPRRFAADVPISFTDEGDVDETEVQWFDTREEAEAAVNRRPTL